MSRSGSGRSDSCGSTRSGASASCAGSGSVFRCGRPIRFLVWYVARGGFLDGRPGFVFCVLMSYYEFIIGAKLRELES